MDRRCGKMIEAKPTLGQISPSEAAWAPADRPGGDLVSICPLPTRGQQRSRRNQVCVRINGGKTAGRERQASSASSLRNRSGLLEENFEWDPRQLSANDSELLMPIFASPVAGERCEAMSPFGRDAPGTELADDGSPVQWQGQDENSRLEQRRIAGWRAGASWRPDLSGSPVRAARPPGTVGRPLVTAVQPNRRHREVEGIGCQNVSPMRNTSTA